MSCWEVDWDRVGTESVPVSVSRLAAAAFDEAIGGQGTSEQAHGRNSGGRAQSREPEYIVRQR